MGPARGPPPSRRRAGRPASPSRAAGAMGRRLRRRLAERDGRRAGAAHPEPAAQQDERGGDQRQHARPLRGQGDAAGGAAGEEQPQRPIALHVPQGEVDAEHRPGGHEDVQGGDARLRHAQRVRGGEQQRQQRPGWPQAQPSGDGVHAGEQHHAGDDGRHAPAEGAVAEQHDAGGDGHLAELGMGPRDLVARLPAVRRLRRDTAVHDGLGVLGVVDLVEHVVGGRREMPQAHARRHQEDDGDEQHVAMATAGLRDGAEAVGSGCETVSVCPLRGLAPL